MTTIAPGRLRGIATMLAAVTLALITFAAIAQPAAPGLARWMADGDSTMEGGQEAVVGRRIAGAAARLRRGAQPPPDLGVILGSSAAGRDIEPLLLETAACLPIPSRWLSLYADGANTSDLRGLAELLAISGLRTKLLLLGLHPALLARSETYLSDSTLFDTSAFWREFNLGHLTTAKQELEALTLILLNRIFSERTRISHQARVIASAWKRRLFTALGLCTESLFAADVDPWTVNLPGANEQAEGRNDDPFHGVAARELPEGPMREGLQGEVKDKGWFNPACYVADGPNARDMVAIISEARTRGTEVVILLLPERSDLRSRIPPEAMLCLKDALARSFGEDSPTVIDLRDAMPDESFHDTLHLNKASRGQFTLALAKALKSRDGWSTDQ